MEIMSKTKTLKSPVKKSGRCVLNRWYVICFLLFNFIFIQAFWDLQCDFNHSGNANSNTKAWLIEKTHQREIVPKKPKTTADIYYVNFVEKPFSSVSAFSLHDWIWLTWNYKLCDSL